MRGKYLFDRANASSMGSTPTEVTVTHPFHPLYGQRLEVERVMRGKLSHLIVVVTPDGKGIRLHRDWTDFNGARGGIEEHTSSLPLDIRGLRAAAEIVEELKKQTPDEEK